MRLKIFLEPESRNYLIPINYQYQLSSAVYNIIRNGSEEYANWLHEVGFTDETGKKMKFFTFSNLYFENYKVLGDTIRTEGNAYYYFSTPYETKSADVFVKGIISNQRLVLNFSKNQLLFNIKSVEMTKKPDFAAEMEYKTITPVTVSTMIEINDMPKVHYIRPNENGFIEAIKRNLLRKYKLLYGFDYLDVLNISFIESKKIYSKLIHIKEGRNDESQIKGFIMHLKIECSKDMHQLIYDVGLGNLNSQGFGMVELLKK